MNTLEPEYNILKLAGNRKGFVHKEASKKLQRTARSRIKLSE